MRLRALLSIPSAIVAYLSPHLSANTTRAASTMVLDPAKMNVLNGPLQPHTTRSDSTHPAGFYRDGYCWGSPEDPGQHFIGGVVTKEFLDFSKSRGNDLTTQTSYFPGLRDGCRWCLCVARWKEALLAAPQMGDKVVPKVDLGSTSYEALKSVNLEDLRRFEWQDNGHREL